MITLLNEKRRTGNEGRLKIVNVSNPDVDDLPGAIRFGGAFDHINRRLAEFVRLLLGLPHYGHKDLIHYYPVFSDGSSYRRRQFHGECMDEIFSFRHLFNSFSA